MLENSDLPDLTPARELLQSTISWLQQHEKKKQGSEMKQDSNVASDQFPPNSVVTKVTDVVNAARDSRRLIEQLLTLGQCAKILLLAPTQIGCLFESEPSPSGGLIVRKCQKDNSVMAAGLRTGDVIVQLNGLNLRSEKDLFASIANAHAGDRIPLVYSRKEAVVGTILEVGAQGIPLQVVRAAKRLADLNSEDFAVVKSSGVDVPNMGRATPILKSRPSTQGSLSDRVSTATPRPPSQPRTADSRLSRGKQTPLIGD